MGQVTAHPDAVAELRGAVRYYEDKSAGLARRFFREVHGDAGHHFDNVKVEFIRDHVEFLLMVKPVPPL
ncbi:MAG: hypothetical protein ACR2OZ_20680 [Verrucomicrobiales bacterium]